MPTFKYNGPAHDFGKPTGPKTLKLPLQDGTFQYVRNVTHKTTTFQVTDPRALAYVRSMKDLYGNPLYEEIA